MAMELRQQLSDVILLAANGYWDEVIERIRVTPALATQEDEIQGYLLIRLARIAGSAKALRAALAHGADVNYSCSGSGNALTATIEGGSTHGLTTLEELRTLLDAGADVHVIAMSGYPPLHWAIVMNRLDHAKLLLEYGADPYQQSEDYVPETAFDVAKRVRNAGALEVLATSSARRAKGDASKLR